MRWSEMKHRAIGRSAGFTWMPCVEQEHTIFDETMRLKRTLRIDRRRKPLLLHENGLSHQNGCRHNLAQDIVGWVHYYPHYYPSASEAVPARSRREWKSENKPDPRNGSSPPLIPETLGPNARRSQRSSVGT